MKKIHIALLLFISVAWASQTTTQTLTAGAGYGAPIRIQQASYGPMVPTVTVIPGSGGTMLVQYTTTDWTTVQNGGTVNWVNWNAGSVSSATSYSLSGSVTAIHAEAVTANGTLEVSQ